MNKTPGGIMGIGIADTKMTLLSNRDLALLFYMVASAKYLSSFRDRSLQINLVHRDDY